MNDKELRLQVLRMACDRYPGHNASDLVKSAETMLAFVEHVPAVHRSGPVPVPSSIPATKYNSVSPLPDFAGENGTWKEAEN